MLGAPGSGKGTQAKILEQRFGLPQISTGDLLRQAVADATPLGLKAKETMDAGGLVSDQVVLGMIRERLQAGDTQAGFILDGYPRNRAQAQDLEGVFGELGLTLDFAVLMDVDIEILMKRLTGRRTCSKTGKLLNVFFSPQAEIDACLEAGGELLQREDDNEETIRNRLQVYESQTSPLIEHYAAQNRLLRVAADDEVEAVSRVLIATLGLA
jgi:adenylate kinase